MIEYSIKHYFDSIFMCFVYQLLKSFIPSELRIDIFVIYRFIFMVSGGTEHRIKIDQVYPEINQIGELFTDTDQVSSVIAFWRGQLSPACVHIAHILGRRANAEPFGKDLIRTCGPNPAWNAHQLIGELRTKLEIIKESQRMIKCVGQSVLGIEAHMTVRANKLKYICKTNVGKRNRYVEIFEFRVRVHYGHFCFVTTDIPFVLGAEIKKLRLENGALDCTKSNVHFSVQRTDVKRSGCMQN